MVLICIVALTVVSVTGRSLTFLGLGPLRGDFELVEIGTAYAIFAFLPWCHLRNGHASVDILVGRMSTKAGQTFQILADALVLAFAILLTWRHALGMIDKRAYLETTFLLQIPLWWAYAASLAGAIIFVAVAAWCLFLSLTGQER